MAFRTSRDILNCRQMRVPRTVWTLGFVSLCMDLSSELVHGLLPVFMTVVLGAGMVAVGVVEGIAEATASIVKVFSGVLSDRLGRRKPLVVLIVFVREPPATFTAHANPLSRAALGELTLRYWFVVALGAVFTLARFSEAFLVLRAQDLGMALALVPIVLVVMNLAYTAIAYQAGLAADKGYRNHLLLWGLVALIAADLVIAAFASLAALFAGVVLWGAHMGLTQGLLSALVADTAPAPLRGTAFGVFHLVSGVALLAASVLAGWLWSEYGAAATFDAGAALAAAALARLVTYSYVSRTRP